MTLSVWYPLLRHMFARTATVNAPQLTVLAIADAVSTLLYDYFDPDRWRDVDLVLSAGDLPPEYLDFLCTNLGVPVLYVRGNHDGHFEAQRYDGCLNVHGRHVVPPRGLGT